MIKTLEQINQEFITACVTDKPVSDLPGEQDAADAVQTPDPQGQGTVARRFLSAGAAVPVMGTEAPARRRHPVRRVFNVLFYSTITILLAITIVLGGGSREGFRLFGYAGYTVTTDSMQRELPVGALVIVKKTAPEDIQKGDDITFMLNENVTVTHKVTNIIEDYAGTGARGFETWGVENASVDPDITYAADVIGVVKYSIPGLGATLSYISENIGYIFLLLGGLAVTAVSGSWFISESRKKKHQEKQSAGEVIYAGSLGR